MNDLLGGSLFFLYIFSVVTVANYSKFDNKQKISILYILTYGIEFNRSSTQVNSGILYISFICSVFLLEEYWNDDKYKNKLIKRIVYKITDFLYQFIFVYKGIIFSAAYFILANKDKINIKIQNIYNQNFEWITVAISAVMLVLAIHSIFTWSVEHFSYTEMMNRINQYPYYKMLENELSEEEFEKRLYLITDMEDRFFFQRKSYTVLSLEYIKRYVQKEQGTPSFQKEVLYRFKRNWKCKKGIRRKIKFLLRSIKQGVKYIVYLIHLKIEKCSTIRRKIFARGHSTIEMQLFRTLSYKSGIKLGKPRGVKEAYDTLVRKGYEVFFTHIFFSGLRQYLLDNGVVNVSYYRQYIVYLYVHTVIAWYNGKRYMPMDRLFGEKKVSEWDMEMLFIEGLGLSRKTKVKMERIECYHDIISKYRLDIHKIEKLIAQS